MLSILNNQTKLMNILALIISIVALIATLRKKEFGKFYFVDLDHNNDDIWIKVIKSDLYDVKFICEPYENMSCRINILNENDDKDSVLGFPNETNPIVKIGLLKENAILKFRNCNSSKVHIHFIDKYNNVYNQELNHNKISERKHKNIWNLTFVGT
jgi:hypothetical protein